MKRLTVCLALALATSPALADLAIKRVFQSSASYTKLLIETDKTRRVKCAVFDRQDNPLRVDTQTVTPPLDEVLMHTGEMTSAVHTAKCWEMG